MGPTKSNRIIRPSKPSWLCWFPCEPTGLSWPPFPFQRSPAVAFNPGSHIKITCGTSKKTQKNKNWCLAPAQGAEKENRSRWATSTTRPVPQHNHVQRAGWGELQEPFGGPDSSPPSPGPSTWASFHERSFASTEVWVPGTRWWTVPADLPKSFHSNGNHTREI